MWGGLCSCLVERGSCLSEWTLGAAVEPLRPQPAHDQPICPTKAKVHTLTDVIGRPYTLTLTAGNVSDIKAAPTLLERAGRMRYLLADKGYDPDPLRRSVREAGATPVIPAGPTANARSATTGSATAGVALSRTPSAA